MNYPIWWHSSVEFLQWYWIVFIFFLLSVGCLDGLVVLSHNHIMTYGTAQYWICFSSHSANYDVDVFSPAKVKSRRKKIATTATSTAAAANRKKRKVEEEVEKKTHTKLQKNTPIIGKRVIAKKWSKVAVASKTPAIETKQNKTREIRCYICT